MSPTLVFPVEFVKFWKNLFWRKYVNDCFWNLFKFHQDCPFLITYTSDSNRYICLDFGSQFTLSFANSPFTTVDTSIIRSSRPVVLYKFRKIHKKTPAVKTRFLWICRSTEFNFIKKEIPVQIISCEFYEISHSTFFRLFGRVLLY